MPNCLIRATRLRAATPSGRLLFQELSLSLECEKVALVGRNGAGKTTLLEILAGVRSADAGQLQRSVDPYLIAQLQSPERESHGQLRRRRLAEAFDQKPKLLLLDEPSQDLDWEGIEWLRRQLAGWTNGALVVSHDTALLQDFQHFFILSESGGRYFGGSLDQLQFQLERDEETHQKRYLSGLHLMVEKEEHSRLVARRRARKERYGRVREMDRAGPRIVLNLKRNQAQATHGKQKVQREARLEAIRQLAKVGRRALQVDLPLVLPAPEWGRTSPEPILWGSGLRLRHQRVGLTGPNGSGKTTLLESLDGDATRFGRISQGGANWLLDECMLDRVEPEALVAHKFPLALAERSIRSLSPGERVRAALICLLQRAPVIEMLVLDEPTYSLDLPGKKSLTAALQAWPGGLLVASHDLDFLSDIGVQEWIRLE